MFKVVFTKEFASCLREIQKAGGQGRSIVQKARAAQAEAATEGKIQGLSRTKHGESRLSNVEKYDMGDGHRLVVQLVDGPTQARAFLYCGKHDDSERWLEAHRDYKWVEKTSDRTLEFVQVSKADPPVAHIPDIDLDTPPSLLDLPLLRDLTDADWISLRLPNEAVEYARSVTGQNYELDGTGVLEHLDRVCGAADRTNILLDLLDHAHRKEWNALHQRIGLIRGVAVEVAGTAAADLMLDPVNAEIFVSWEDTKDLPLDQDWAEWMLFLHPEQKELAHRELNGPGRLRGVSGSGKTCVMVHRARYLARKYGQRLLVVTLTESMRRLLDSLLGILCGAERGLIETVTMSGLAKDVIRDLHPRGERWYTMVSADKIDEIRRGTVELVRQHPDLERSLLRSLGAEELWQFLSDEIIYVRSRLRQSEYHVYPTRQFKRQGRQQALAEVGRKICLEAIQYWDSQLARAHGLDHEGIVQQAVDLVDGQDETDPRCRWRSVLVDEVQDLSQLEVSLLAKIYVPDGNRIAAVPNGLFLVGDGAQTIYKRGFSLRGLGVNVSGRSFAFRKNYRNTKEILAASYGLIQTYEFADVDEDNLSRPIEPELASRHGEKPYLVRCAGLTYEAEFVGAQVAELIADQSRASNANICVIGTNQRVRDAVVKELGTRRIAWAELRADAGVGAERVKVSTIESAKGHEFANVFIVGLIEGVLPRSNNDDDIPREAARLYVAMTRARDCLFLTYSSNNQVGPSRFLPAIQAKCNEMSWTSGRLCPLD
jgi:superfamily I DNA/RNA helicase